MYTVRICNPSQAARSDSRDLECDSVSLAKLGRPVLKKPCKRAIDVAEAEKAEIERADGEALEQTRFQSLECQSSMLQESTALLETRNLKLETLKSYPITVVCSGVIL